MSGEKSPRGRSSLAVAIGYILTIALVGLTYPIAIAFFPGAIPKSATTGAPCLGLLVMAAILRFLYAVLGDWTTTILAGRPGIGPGLALAGVILILGLLKPLLAPHRGPLWSPMILRMGS